ncbi:cytosine permease [Brachybacterium sp. Marseille-Q2903]|uniref:Cytosine permease n=1 Tax=Brachybacterium epidermidis TaxID=2781983 RepID=A0ABR9W3C2_9MICO|nr:cytosine permease [Brachybacterium epidermidis]MBE9404907.1 cytosine permease [Brachybacterium epidermidis]
MRSQRPPRPRAPPRGTVQVSVPSSPRSHAGTPPPWSRRVVQCPVTNSAPTAPTADAPPRGDHDYSLEPVPLSARRGFWAVGFVMLGFTFFSASMSVGARLGNGLDLTGFLAATTIGGLILAAYTGALGYIGARTGMSMDLLAQRAFGVTGSLLPSALIALTQMGWFGVGVAMFALPTGDLLGIGPWPIVIIAGALMTASAYYGIRAIEIVSFVSVPLIAVLGTYSMITATTDGGGLAEVFAASSGMPLVMGIGLVMGSFVSGGTATPNFTRFARSPRIAVITTVVAFLLGNALMFGFGAVGGAFTGQEDIFYVMIAQGLAIPALIVLGANIWTTNNNALYTTGLGFANVTKIDKRPLVLVAGAVGTLSALWLYDNFVVWLNVLNATLPPIGAILIADFLRHRRAYVGTAAKRPARRAGLAWGSVLGVVVGGLVGWFVPLGIASINAMAVAVACYLLGDLLTGRPDEAAAPERLSA